jgi:phosphohistidine phosphatase SixA
MGKTNIFLVRHGEKNVEGKNSLANAKTHLSEKGKKQAQLLAKRLNTMTQRKPGTASTMEKIVINKIISSDLPRCVQTAKIINKVLKKPISYDSALREITGSSLNSIREKGKEKKDIRKFYENITKEKGNLLVVTSGNVIKYFVSRIWNIPSKKVSLALCASAFNHFTVDEKGKTNIVCLNDSKHLTDKLKISKHMVKRDLKSSKK